VLSVEIPVTSFSMSSPELVLAPIEPENKVPEAKSFISTPLCCSSESNIELMNKSSVGVPCTTVTTKMYSRFILFK